MIAKNEIVSTLGPLNGGYFRIDDLNAYAEKVCALGKAITLRNDGRLVAYVLFYDNQQDVFVSMVWTSPESRRCGVASALLRQLCAAVPGRDVRLDVHKDNPARKIYARLYFEEIGESGDMIHMRR